MQEVHVCYNKVFYKRNIIEPVIPSSQYMNSSVPVKTPEQVKGELKQYLEDIDVEVVKEFDEEEFWGFWVKFGDFPIMVENKKGTRYCAVAFQITLPDGSQVQKLNEYYARKNVHFVYDLTCAFTSPITGFSRIIENGQIIGFTISRYIYPFYDDFSVKDLDRAIQAVVSVGSVGIAFLNMALSESPGAPLNPGKEQ
jgi:hypothetical protein